METIRPYLLGWLVPTILSTAVGYLAGLLRKAKAERESDRRTLDDLTLMVCRLTLYNDNFDMDEKLEAYVTYVAKGGNHRTKKYMDELLGEDVDAYLARHR